MKTLDQILGWLMIALGVAHCVTTLRLQPPSVAAGLSASAVVIILGGFLNVSRARNKDGLTRAFSLIANIVILVLAVATALPLRSSFLHDWQKLSIIILATIEFFFALRGR